MSIDTERVSGVDDVWSIPDVKIRQSAFTQTYPLILHHHHQILHLLLFTSCPYIQYALTPQLLRRFFSLLHAHNPELAGEKRRYTIVPPQVAREGTKKTMFSNLTDIARRMHRHPEHMIQFLYSELGTQGSVDGNQRLIMKGRYTQKQIESVLRKYIGEFGWVWAGLCGLDQGKGRAGQIWGGRERVVECRRWSWFGEVIRDGRSEVKTRTE